MLTALFSLLYLKKKKTALFASTSKSPKQKKKKKNIINTISLQLVLAHLSLSLCVSTTGYRNIRSEPKNSTPVFITDPFKFQSSRHFPTWLSLSAPSLSLSKKKTFHILTAILFTSPIKATKHHFLWVFPFTFKSLSFLTNNAAFLHFGDLSVWGS